MQDRDQRGERTPRWRGVTLLHELRSHAIPVAIASDNTRDQFYAYGDLDMLEVFNQVLTAPPCPSSPTHRPSDCALPPTPPACTSELPNIMPWGGGG